ncbi:hypothetical protein [Kitasatospora sp. HPMI-4]|uniref:hypothetical protein n=1 Tax=Kitasatospora sp. HPMI-4 TaxID=3448443 RepID=UPI003F1BA87D
MDAATIWTAVGAIAAAASAGLAWWATRKAAAAASDSAATAREVAAIERDRWHRELTPELEFTLTQRGRDHWRLTVELVGPAGLDRLDSLTLTVRDEAGVDHSPRPGGPDPQELAAVIWGPLRIQPGVDGVREPGRERVLLDVERGEPIPCALEATLVPGWFQNPEDWRERNATLPLRLRAVCEREGHHPWIVLDQCAVPRTADQ